MKRICSVFALFVMCLTLGFTVCFFAGCTDNSKYIKGKFTFCGIVDEETQEIVKYEDLDEETKSILSDYVGSYIEYKRDGRFTMCLFEGEGDYTSEKITHGTYEVKNEKIEMVFSKEQLDAGYRYKVDYVDGKVVVSERTYFLVYTK